MNEIDELREENKLLKFKLLSVKRKNEEQLREIERLKQEMADTWNEE